MSEIDAFDSAYPLQLSKNEGIDLIKRSNYIKEMLTSVSLLVVAKLSIVYRC